MDGPRTRHDIGRNGPRRIRRTRGSRSPDGVGWTQRLGRGRGLEAAAPTAGCRVDPSEGNGGQKIRRDARPPPAGDETLGGRARKTAAGRNHVRGGPLVHVVRPAGHPHLRLGGGVRLRRTRLPGRPAGRTVGVRRRGGAHGLPRVLRERLSQAHGALGRIGAPPQNRLARGQRARPAPVRAPSRDAATRATPYYPRRCCSATGRTRSGTNSRSRCASFDAPRAATSVRGATRARASGFLYRESCGCRRTSTERRRTSPAAPRPSVAFLSVGSSVAFRTKTRRRRNDGRQSRRARRHGGLRGGRGPAADGTAPGRARAAAAGRGLRGLRARRRQARDDARGVRDARLDGVLLRLERRRDAHVRGREDEGFDGRARKEAPQVGDATGVAVAGARGRAPTERNPGGARATGRKTSRAGADEILVGTLSEDRTSRRR